MQVPVGVEPQQCAGRDYYRGVLLTWIEQNNDRVVLPVTQDGASGEEGQELVDGPRVSAHDRQILR